MIVRLSALLIAIATFAAFAAARAPDGTLALLRAPHNGAPAIAQPGETFDVTLEIPGEEAPEEAPEARLVGVLTGYPIEATWTHWEGNRWRGQAIAPADAEPGLYALDVAWGAHEDRTPRAVYISPPVDEYYTVALLSDFQAETQSGGGSERPALDTVEAVNRAGVAFALLTGNLTEQGQAGEYVRFLDLLDTFQVPTFVCPGPNETKTDQFTKFFGQMPYAFQHGEDAYLVFDAEAARHEGTAQDGDLHRYRRIYKPARWCFAVTHRYTPAWDLRTQLTLFVDDPVDYVLAGYQDETPQPAPWNNTPIAPAAPANQAQVRILDVGAGKVVARPLQGAEEF